MPEQNQVAQPDEALIGLLTERDALHRRLAWVEGQVSHLQLGRHDAALNTESEAVEPPLSSSRKATQT